MMLRRGNLRFWTRSGHKRVETRGQPRSFSRGGSGLADTSFLDTREAASSAAS
jgi:hypothetical protein